MCKVVVFNWIDFNLTAKSKNESKGQEDKIVVPLPVVVPPPPEGPEEQKSDTVEKPEI